MRKFLILALLLCPLASFGQVFSHNAWCEKGGQGVVTQGLKSAGTFPLPSGSLVQGAGVQGSYPLCHVAVFLTGTSSPATLFSDIGLDPITNPFTANADGSYLFFAGAACYDITTSGGGMPAPHTETDVCLGGASPGGGVSLVTVGDLSPLFASHVANPTSTPAVTYTLTNAGAHTVFGNGTGSTGTPGYFTLGTGDLPFTYSGTGTLLATVSGSFSGTGASVCRDASGNLTTAGCAGAGVTSFNSRSGAVTPQTGDYTVTQVTGAAPLASPPLTGIPTAPTASPGTNTTQLATTAFVLSNGAVTSFNSRTGAVTPQSGDYSVGQVTGAAPNASPSLTGIPLAPTAAPGTNNTQIATTAFVLSNVNLPSQVGATPGSVLKTDGSSPGWQAKPVCDTRDMNGADLGLRINQCTAEIGFTTTTIPGGFIAKYIGTPGTIRVDSADAGAISTQVIIPSNQILSLGNGHYTNNFGDFIPPITLSDNSALQCDSWGTQIDNTSQNVGENIVVGMTNTLVCSSPAPPPCGAGGCEANCSFPPTVGVTVNSCHFKQSSTGNRSGSSLTGTVSLAQCQGCKVLNSWFDGIGTTAVTLVGSFAYFSTHPEWSYVYGHDDELAGNLVTGVANAGFSIINNEKVDIHDNFFRDHFDGAAAYIDLESNNVLDHMQYINVHHNTFDCSVPPANPAQCYGITMQSVGPSVGHLKFSHNILFGPLVAPGGYTVGGIGSVDFNAHGNNEVEIDSNQISYTTTSPIAIAGGDNGRVYDNLLSCTRGGIQISPGVTHTTISGNVISSPLLTSFTVTSVASTADNLTTVYTGTFTGGGSNGLANQVFTIAGFPTNPTNNGTFGATASTATTLTVTNPAGVSETHAATATTGCASGLTGSQNFSKIFETDSTDDFNLFKGNVGASQIIKYGAHSQIFDVAAPDNTSQTFNVPVGFGNPIPGGIFSVPITPPVLNGLGPINIAACTGILPSATYDYIITAVASNGFEAPSNEVAASVTLGQCTRLGWTYSAGADHYNVYRGTASGNEQLVANEPQGTLGYADPGGQTPTSTVPTSNLTSAFQFGDSGSFGSTQTNTTAPCELAFGASTLATGATTTDTALNCLPAGSVIDSVVYRITTTITTAASFTIGDASTAGRFCGTQSTLTAGTTGVCFVQADQTGAAGPRQPSAAKVRVTTNANPGAGAIRLIVYYHTWIAPTS